MREQHHGVALNATYDADGAAIYEHALQPRLRGHRVEAPARLTMRDAQIVAADEKSAGTADSAKR